MIINGNILTPDNGYKYITNGTVFSQRVILGKLDTPNNWHDTNDEPQEEELNEDINNSGLDGINQ